jgi:hypothetical protein
MMDFLFGDDFNVSIERYTEPTTQQVREWLMQTQGLWNHPIYVYKGSLSIAQQISVWQDLWELTVHPDNI